MNQEFTITAFSENSIGLLNRITIIFTRRRLNIESLTVSASAIRGIHKFTIVVNTTQEQIEKVTLQIEKLVEVLKAYYHVTKILYIKKSHCTKCRPRRCSTVRRWSISSGVSVHVSSK